MLDFLKDKSDSKNAMDILKRDHDTVKDLFEQFEEAKSRQAKVRIAGQTILELKLHAAIEEEVFYPAVRKQIGKSTMNEADEEHHVAKVLLAELEQMDGSEDHYDGKFKVLSESVVHHIKDEESEMFPKAKSLDVDYEALGEKMLEFKQKLMDKGIPKFAEEKMVAAMHGKGDSPAHAAQKTIKAPRKD